MSSRNFLILKNYKISFIVFVLEGGFSGKFFTTTTGTERRKGLFFNFYYTGPGWDYSFGVYNLGVLFWVKPEIASVIQTSHRRADFGNPKINIASSEKKMLSGFCQNQTKEKEENMAQPGVESFTVSVHRYQQPSEAIAKKKCACEKYHLC